MKITLYKIEHENLELCNERIKPYMSEPARGKFLEYLDVVDFPVKVNSIFRSCQEQTKLYLAYKRGESSVQAARSGYSAHEFGYGIDLNCSAMDNWEQIKKDLIRYGYSGLKSERWHINHLGNYKTNLEKVLASVQQVLTIEEAKERLKNLGYDDNVEQFQIDFGLQQDGIIGREVSTQLVLMTKEYEFVD